MDSQEKPDSNHSMFLESGTRVRFATPNFVIHATVLAHRPPSLTIMSDAGKRLIIPLADWYLEQPPDAREHICVITDAAIDPHLLKQTPDATERFIYVRDAAEIARVEEKQLRRYIRKGELPAFKDNGMWMVDRDRFITFAGDHGWL